MAERYRGRNGESSFENDFVEMLEKSGWTDGVLTHLTVQQKGSYDPDQIRSLEGNLRRVIDIRNRGTLNNVPLSDSEFDQVMEKINKAYTPVLANILLTGKDIVIKRDSDSPDTEHAGKAVYLNLFNNAEIGSGSSIYQIARQIKYETGSMSSDRRGDVTLLINGLPVIHIELKASGVDITEALNQIQKYKSEGVFKGLMGMVQVFFAMSPEDAVYFANYNTENDRNDSYVFHWADSNNEPIKDWRRLCSRGGSGALLTVPEAHQLVCYYTVADKARKTLKVMRSYQVEAVRKMVRKAKLHNWDSFDSLGGVCWVTTGGGKTMTAFKAGQMMRDLQFADKIVFVVDRVDLNMQAYSEYNSFYPHIDDDNETKGEVLNTETSKALAANLMSSDNRTSLMITSIQKMNNIREEAWTKDPQKLQKIRQKRIVFIVDEAQRSQFGTMHENAKGTFPNALFFGFTGTPVMADEKDENHDTRTVFGDYLSVYTIAQGIRDGNVLGFDARFISTFPFEELRERVALDQAHAISKDEAMKIPAKWKIYKEFKNRSAATEIRGGIRVKGIEEYLPTAQYDCDEHREAVLRDILKNWDVISIGTKQTRFHGMLAANSIREVIEYYHLFKEKAPQLNVTAVFDPSVKNNGRHEIEKEKALREIILDYNERYETAFTLDEYGNFKRDVMARLAHKDSYTHIGNDHSKIIDLLLVDNQLLTGYDSVYVNALYLDKVMEKHQLIQAISRTNRVFDADEKPFGLVRIYRKPGTMEENLKKALEMYCMGDGDGVQVPSAEENIKAINETYERIRGIFERNHIKNFTRLPDAALDRNEFKEQFTELKKRLRALTLQGEVQLKKTDRYDYEWAQDDKLTFSNDQYNALWVRFDDMTGNSQKADRNKRGGFDLEGNPTEMKSILIDSDYLEKHFRLILPDLESKEKEEERKNQIIKEFSEDFGKLTAKEQRYATQVLEDIRDDKLHVEEDVTFLAYIYEYIDKAVSDAVRAFSSDRGINADKLMDLVESNPTEADINQGRRVGKLIEEADIDTCTSFYHSSVYAAKRDLAKDIQCFVLETIPAL